MSSFSILATKKFDREIRRFLNNDEISELCDYLVSNPLAGKLIKNTGGLRKFRWQSGNRGKSGGLRIIYFFHREYLIILLTTYSKSAKEDLSKEEQTRIQLLLATIQKEISNEK